MASALYVRESIDLSDAAEQRLLRFARLKGLQTGDTLVVAVRSLSAVPGYVFDLRDPADPTYLLNIVVVADVLTGSGLTVDVSGADATAQASPGAAGRSVRFFVRDVEQALTVRANGGAGTAGVDGAAGADETFTIDFDERGKPHREYESPTPGEAGGNGGPGGPGGTARVVWSTGAAPQVSAAGGAGGAAGQGGPGGKGAVAANGQRRPGAPAGPDGQAGPLGLGGTASSEQRSTADFWAAARAELGEDLVAGAAHWLAVAEYRYRRVKGSPTAPEADDIVGLLDLTLAASPGRQEAAVLREQFLNGDNFLGLPRNLDVVPDFERYMRRLELYGNWVGGLFTDAKNLLTATTSIGLTEAQLGVQLNTLDFTATVLQAAKADAAASVAVADAEERGAAARWSAAVDAVNRKRTELEQPIDWGGIVVVGMFSLVGMILSVYAGQTVGKLIGSIPDLMVLGNVNFSGSEKETQILKDAVKAGGSLSSPGGKNDDDKDKLPTAGAKDAAKNQDGAGQIDVAKWAGEAGGVVISFAKFVKDIDEASGDAALKQLVKDLALRLQERLAAKARADAAKRQLALAQLRIDGVVRERALYAALHTRARGDVTVLRETALTLLSVVRRYGDVFLDNQVRAARAVEIYTMTDQSPSMAVDRWHVHPDIERDFADDLIDAAEYQSRLLASTTELAIVPLQTAFDDYDMAGFTADVHYVTINDPAAIETFRSQRTASFTVAPGDLAGDRWQAKVMAATVTLHGATAATPTFGLLVRHGDRCTDRLQNGTEVSQLLEPRSTLVQIAGNGGVAVGAAAGPADQRPVDFWRRSVATDWSLAIEDGVAQQRHVDLSGLTKIDVALSYVALMT